MPRQLRIEYPGAIYHVMNRGDRREPIFKDDLDRERFLATLSQACDKTGWQVHAYCLMSNHFHLVLETPQANLVAGMKWFLGTYTARFNRRHKLFGHLFSGRYKSIVVDGSGNGYLRTVGDYVHLNPVRARLLTPDQSLRNYRWSSYGQYLKPPGKRAPWLRVDRLLGEMGIPQDSAAGRREFELNMEQRRSQETGPEWKGLQRGWCFGDETFRQELLAQAEGKFGANHYASQRQESSEAKARRIVAEELRRLGWKQGELEKRLKADPDKVRIARRLRGETTMTLKWIAERLRMGSWSYVANNLYQPKARNPANYK
jgi:REP element-mobilizing transposase RayT